MPFKILILKPSSLGDIIHALPVLRLLKLHLPASQIYWWVDTRFSALIEGDPDLTGIVRFERERWTSPRYWPEMIQSIRWMREQEFDWVIDLQGLGRSAIFSWLARGKLLIGLDNEREGGREGARAFYDLAIRSPKGAHAVDRLQSVLPVLGVPVHKNFQWLPERPQVAAQVKGKWPMITKARWVAIQPGSRWPTKCWPTPYFTNMVHMLTQKFHDVHFAVMGSADDKARADIIHQAAPQRVLNLCGQTTLQEMIEWLRLCSLMVTNDTGPMHVAAALGVPLVAPFGPTDPHSTGPYGQIENVLRIDLPCAPCFKSSCRWHHPMECLTAISPAMVYQSAQRKLGNKN